MLAYPLEQPQLAATLALDVRRAQLVRKIGHYWPRPLNLFSCLCSFLFPSVAERPPCPASATDTISAHQSLNPRVMLAWILSSTCCTAAVGAADFCNMFKGVRPCQKGLINLNPEA